MTLVSILLFPYFWYWSNLGVPVVLRTPFLFIVTNPWELGDFSSVPSQFLILSREPWSVLGNFQEYFQLTPHLEWRHQGENWESFRITPSFFLIQLQVSRQTRKVSVSFLVFPLFRLVVPSQTRKRSVPLLVCSLLGSV